MVIPALNAIPFNISSNLWPYPLGTAGKWKVYKIIKGENAKVEKNT